jgi:hypothetical protein
MWLTESGWLVVGWRNAELEAPTNASWQSIWPPSTRAALADFLNSAEFDADDRTEACPDSAPNQPHCFTSAL